MLKSVPLDFASFWGGCRKRFQVAIRAYLDSRYAALLFFMRRASPLAPFESSESVTKMFRKKFSKKMLDRYAFDWYTT